MCVRVCRISNVDLNIFFLFSLLGRWQRSILWISYFGPSLCESIIEFSWGCCELSWICLFEHWGKLNLLLLLSELNLKNWVDFCIAVERIQYELNLIELESKKWGICTGLTNGNTVNQALTYCQTLCFKQNKILFYN